MVLELLNNAPATKVPPALSLSDDAALGMEIKSTPVKQKSDVATYRENDKIIFNIPSDFADFREAYITFTAIIDAAGAGSSYDRFSDPIGSIIRRLRTMVGSKSAEDIENYGVLRGICRLAKPSAIVNNLEEGSTANATRATQSIASRQYQLKLEVQSLEKVLPLHKSSMPFRVELTLGSVDSVLESDGTNPTYLVSNAFIHYRTLTVPDSYDSLLDQKIASGGLVIPYRSWNNFVWSNLSGASAQIEIPSKYTSCNRQFAVMRNLADVADLTVTDKFLNFNPNDIDQLALKVGQRIFPNDKYDLAYDAFKYELLHAFTDVTNNRYHGRFRYGDILAAGTWQQNTILSFDLRDDASVDEDLYGNGIDTASSGSSMTLQITLGGAPASAQEVQVFTEYEAAMQFMPGGRINIYN